MNSIEVQVSGGQGIVPSTYKTIVLKPNIVNGKNMLTQAMFAQTDTKYVIKYDYIITDEIITGKVQVLSTNISQCINPAYTEALAAYNEAHDAWIDADNAYTNNPNDTTLAAKNAAYATYNAAQTTLNNTPQYYYYAAKAISLHKGQHIIIPDNCVLLNSSLNALAGFEITPVNSVVYIGSLIPETYEYTIQDAIKIPARSLIELDGGSISNGTLVGNNTVLVFEQEEEVVLKNVTLLGEFTYPSANTANKKDNTNGMAKVYLKKNKSFISQVTQSNTIYVIQYDFDLGGESVTIPEGCVLKFEGGNLCNGVIIGHNTSVDAGIVKVFDTNIVISGTWNVPMAYPEWFGYCDNECSDVLQKSIDSFRTIFLTNVYKINKPIRIKGYKRLLGTVRRNNSDVGGVISATNDFSGVSVTYNNETEVISSILYGYMPGDNVDINSVEINGNYVVESCLYGHPKGNFGFSIKSCEIKKFYGAAVRAIMSDSGTVADTVFLFCYIGVLASSYIEDPINDPLKIVGTVSSGSMPNDMRIVGCEFNLGVFGVIAKGISNITVFNNMFGHLSCNALFLGFVGSSYVENNYFEDIFNIGHTIVRGQITNPTVNEEYNEAVANALYEILPSYVKAFRTIIVYNCSISQGKAYFGIQRISAKHVRTSKDDKGISTANNLQGIDSIYYIANGNVKIENLSFVNYDSRILKYQIIVNGYNYIDCQMNNAVVYSPLIKNESSIVAYTGEKITLLNSLPRRNYILDSNWEVDETLSVNVIKDIIECDDILCVKNDTSYFGQRIPINIFEESKTYKCGLMLYNPTSNDITVNISIMTDVDVTPRPRIKNYNYLCKANTKEMVYMLFDINGFSGGNYLYFSIENSDIYHSCFCVTTLPEDLSFSDKLDFTALPNISTIDKNLKMFLNGLEATWRGSGVWVYSDNTIAHRFNNGDPFWGSFYPLSGTTAQRPTATGTAGFKYYDTELKKYIISNGTSWVNVDGSELN